MREQGPGRHPGGACERGQAGDSPKSTSLVIDNYDSFTYNLVQYLGELGAEPRGHRNDAVTVDEVAAPGPEAIVISPGPCTPSEAGHLAGRHPGAGRPRADPGRLPGPSGDRRGLRRQGRAGPGAIHGKTSRILHDGRALFAGLPNPFEATRYHSLVVRRDGLPATLEVSAWTAEGLVMGLRRHGAPGDAPLEGVQFHPESILTGEGKRLLANFLALASLPSAPPWPVHASAR